MGLVEGLFQGASADWIFGALVAWLWVASMLTVFDRARSQRRERRRGPGR